MFLLKILKTRRPDTLYVKPRPLGVITLNIRYYGIYKDDKILLKKIMIKYAIIDHFSNHGNHNIFIPLLSWRPF